MTTAPDHEAALRSLDQKLAERAQALHEELRVISAMRNVIHDGPETKEEAMLDRLSDLVRQDLKQEEEAKG